MWAVVSTCSARLSPCLLLPWLLAKLLSQLSLATSLDLSLGLLLLLPGGLHIAHAGQLAHHVGKRQAAVPLTPGNVPGLVPGSEAARQWWTAQIAHAGALAHHVGKRQAAVPLTPGNISGLVPGSPAAAAWWTALIAHRGQLAHHVKRAATEWPAGVSPAACPNYPFCGLSPIVPVGYVNTAGYPAGVSAAICPGYPYC